MTVGILALQGAFIEHEQMMARLGVKTFQIRQPRDLHHTMDGLIIPGGESTVQGKLLRELDLFAPLQHQISHGLPVFGTCAGLLLLARSIENDTRIHFAAMDITAVRNAYGRQLGSFFVEKEMKHVGTIPMTFIRAPYIVSVSDDVEILAQVRGRIVAARQGRMLVTAFHPELNNNVSVHRYFLHLIAS